MANSSVPPARLAFYEDHQKPTPIFETYEWPEIVDLLTEHEVTDCAEANGLPAGSPCPGGKKCKAKFTLAFSPGAPREGTTRRDSNVESVSLLVYDFDHLWESELEEICDRLAGLESLIYSTHSHQASFTDGLNDNCVRIVLPLARPLLPHEFKWVHREVINRYKLQWWRPGEPPKLAGADPNPKDLSRLYFLPTAPQGRPIITGYEQGRLLDLDEILRSAPRPNAKVKLAPAPTGDAPAVAPPVTDIDALRGLLKNYRAKNSERDEGEIISRNELVRRVYAEEPLTKPEEEGQREKSCHRIGKILAYLLPIATPEEAVEELCRKSITSMPVFDDDGEDDTLDARFQKLNYSWRRGITEREAQEAAFAEARLAEKEQAAQLRNWLKSNKRKRGGGELEAGAGAATPPGEPPDDDGGGGGGSDEPPEEEDVEPLTEEQVVEMFVMTTPAKGPPKPMVSTANVVLILSLHPEWEGKIRYNEVTKDIEFKDVPLEPYETTPQQVVTGVLNWLHIRFQIPFTTQQVTEGLMHVAKGNAYNPLTRYLNSLKPTQTNVLDTMLETYCGATLIGPDGRDISGYVRRVSRFWMVGAVARALTPGCKMDNVLIFEGQTGMLKSTAFRVLGGSFFSDSKLDIESKDAMLLAGTNWIHEIAELAGFKQTETEQQKSFFSSSTDNFRAPYERGPTKHPRLAVFAGTTNADRYLNDHTGNRRYWPIRCSNHLDIEGLRAARDEVWAEAVAIFKGARTCLRCQALNVRQPNPEWWNEFAHPRCDQHRWWFNEAENQELEAINNHRLNAHYSEGIKDFFLNINPTHRPEHVTVFRVATDMLHLQAQQVSSQSIAIVRALKVLGFTPDRLPDGTHVHWTPPDLMVAPKRQSMLMRLVKGGGEEPPK